MRPGVRLLMCYHRIAGAAVVGSSALAAGWALLSHRVAPVTVLGGLLALEALAASGAALWLSVRIRRDHSPARVHQHRAAHWIHSAGPPAGQAGWPHQAWEAARMKGTE